MDSPFSDCPTSMRAISTHDVTRPPPRLVRVESHADAARLLNPSHSSDGCGLTFSAGTSACRFADLLLLPGGTDQGAELLGRIQRDPGARSEEHTSELQSLRHLVCRLLLEKKKKKHK